MSAKYIERHTGIFTSRKFIFGGDVPSKAVLEKFKEIQEYMSVPPLFERVEADAQHVLDDSDATPESLADAERLLGLLESMRHIVEFQEMRIESCRKFSEYTDRPAAEELCETAINSVTVSMRDIAEVGYWIGMLHTQLCVRPHEPDAKCGHKVTTSATNGRLSQLDRKHKREQQICTAWKTLLAKHPQWTFAALDEAVAKALHVGTRTVRRARAHLKI